MRICGDVVRNAELGGNKRKDGEYQALRNENGLGTMSGFAAGVRFRSSTSDPHLRQCYQGLEQWNCETGQNHRRFGGVEPGTLFLAFLGRCKEVRHPVFEGDSLGGMALATAFQDACTPGLVPVHFRTASNWPCGRFARPQERPGRRARLFKLPTRETFPIGGHRKASQ